ncbi:MAG TPA: periplasmic heavy metal sensor [Bacteroidota bacterium]
MKSLLSILVFISALAQAQIPPDRGGLLKGGGMGMAAYAELSGFPGPKHVLALKDSLGLTPDQANRTKALVESVTASAKLIGEEIVAAEERLHALFRGSDRVDRTAVQAVLKEIGGLLSDLRYVHLQAHLQMREILTPGQIDLYSSLRGYGKTEEK